MRIRLAIIATLLVSAVVWSQGFSARNPAIRNPVGIGTMPVSSYRDEMIATPSPIDATADLSITGNIRGGKHFRGNVPYRSTSELGLDPGSSSLNSFRSTPPLSSFIRDSTGPEDFGRYSSPGYATRPFYSPEEAAARTIPGRADVLTPLGTGNHYVAGEQGLSATGRTFALEPAPNRYVLPERETAGAAAGFQQFQTYYGPPSRSLSTSDGMFIRGTSSGSQDYAQLPPGEAAAAMREDDRLTLEHLKERYRQPSVEYGRFEDRGVAAGEEGHRLSRLLLPAEAGGKDGVAARDRLRASESPGPLAESGLKREYAPQDNGGLGMSPISLKAGQNVDVTTSLPETMNAPPEYGPLPQSTTKTQPISALEQPDALGRIKRQLDELSRSVESRLQTTPGALENTSDAAQETKTYTGLLESQAAAPRADNNNGFGRADYDELLKKYEPRAGREFLTPATTPTALQQAANGGQTRFEPPTTATLETASKMRTLPEDIAGLSRVEISREAGRIMGRHQSHGSFAEDKFSRHMLDAENHLRAGRYYKAADSFGLALVYRSNDPQALAGRSHALFAAGEYVSSALFLSRALAVRPEYAKNRADFVTLLGGPNRLARRVADIEEWFARSGSAQLQLLLAYVYYQTGRMSESRQAIETANTKMPKSAAVSALTAAISDAEARQ